MLRRYKNTSPPVLLQAEVGASDTTLDVGDATNFPDEFPFIIALERGTSAEEACLVTAKTTTELTVERGFDGTVAQYHPGLDSSGFSAALVEHTTAAIDYREAQIPWITEAERDALDVDDETEVWDGRLVYNADRRSIDIAHYSELGSDESFGNNFIEWAGLLPTGTVLPFSSTDVPTGFLLCDGSAHLRDEYPALNALYSADTYPFGNGDGSTTFNVPDLRQKFPIGVAASGTGSTLGGSGGAIDHSHSQATHTHSVSNHTHSNPSTSNTGNHSHTQGNTGNVGNHTHGGNTTGNTGAHAHNWSDTSSSDNHSHSGSVSGNTGTSSTYTISSGTGFSGNISNHTHSFFDNFGTNSDNHSHTVSGATSNTGNHSHNVGTSDGGGTHSHSNPSTSNTGGHSHTQGVTGSDGGGNTGAAGDETTGTSNPPFLALHFIVKT